MVLSIDGAGPSTKRRCGRSKGCEVGCAHGSDEIADLASVLDALGASTPELTSTASVGNAAAAANAIGHVCRRQPTRQDEVSVDGGWKK
jgi:hypothetical protein